MNCRCSLALQTAGGLAIEMFGQTSPNESKPQQRSASALKPEATGMLPKFTHALVRVHAGSLQVLLLWHVISGGLERGESGRPTYTLTLPKGPGPQNWEGGAAQNIVFAKLRFHRHGPESRNNMCPTCSRRIGRVQWSLGRGPPSRTQSPPLLVPLALKQQDAKEKEIREEDEEEDEEEIQENKRRRK